MAYILHGTDYRKITYAPDHPIPPIVSFLLMHPVALSIFADVLIETNKNDPRRRSQYIDYRLLEAEALGDLSPQEGIRFKYVLQCFLQKADTNDELRGRVVEQILYHIGPITFSCGSINALKKCSIIDTSAKTKVGGEKDFDIGFSNDISCESSMSAELLEAKLQADNFMVKHQQDTFEISNRGREKMRYVEHVRVALEYCRHIIVGIATFQREPKRTLTVLKNEGFSQVHVFNLAIIQSRFMEKFG